MDSFELNKIAGAVLGTLLAVMAIGVLGEFLFHAEQPEQPGWAVAVSEEGGEGGGAAEEEATPLPVLLASADADAGADVAKKCQSCHSFEAGGPNKVGPGLHNVVGREIASHEGFSYSQAFQERAAEGFQWTYEHLAGFLQSPRDYIPGTAMAFAGVKDPQDLANLVVYLRSVTENPPPLPEPEAAPAEGEAAAAEGGEQSGAEQPTMEGEQASSGQPTEPEPQQQAAEQAEQAEMAQQEGAQDQAVASGEAQQATQQEGVDVQQAPEGGVAPVQPAPEDQESLAGAGDEPPATGDGEQPAGQQPAEQEGEATRGTEQQPAAEGQQGAAPAEGDQAATGDSGLVGQIAAAPVEEGESQARKCQACHSLEEGGPNRVGPHLYGVAGRQVAGVEDYSYSEALKGIGGEWTLEKLDAFLADPRGYAKGTKMVFPGIKDDDDRHALVHYLYTLQASPQPLQ